MKMTEKMTQFSIVVVTFLLGTNLGAYSGGDGSVANPFQIAHLEDLITIGNDPLNYDKHFIMTDNILIPSETGRVKSIFNQAIIAPRIEATNGRGESTIPAFSGTFNGNGHCISNLCIKGHSYIGLIGHTTETARIMNLGLENCDIYGEGESVGTLVGQNHGTISACYSTGELRGGASVGGLVGCNWEGCIVSCYSMVRVRHPLSESLLLGDYSKLVGPVEGGFGGLVGVNMGEVIHCYSTNYVHGTFDIGGLVGNNTAVVKYCCWDVETSGVSSSSGGIGLTHADMNNLEMLALNGFALDPNWIYDNHDQYPRLVWQDKTAPVIPGTVIDWLSGEGTPEDPYLIDDESQLLRIQQASLLHDKSFELCSDLDFADHELQNSIMPYFEGQLKGNKYLVSNLTIKGTHNVGFFGISSQQALIQELFLEHVNIIGGDGSTGALVARNHGSISSCYSSGTIQGELNTGGCVGTNENAGSITRSYSLCTILTRHNGGGLVGSNNGTISNCYSSGSVISTPILKYPMGGLVGSNSGTLKDCYSSASVMKTKQSGGLVGIQRGRQPEVSQCFWDIEKSGHDQSDGGMGLSTTAMQTRSTYLEAGWDFMNETENGTNDIWFFAPYGYPQLKID